jgi:hypothetical protein
MMAFRVMGSDASRRAEARSRRVFLFVCVCGVVEGCVYVCVVGLFWLLGRVVWVCVGGWVVAWVCVRLCCVCVVLSVLCVWVCLVGWFVWGSVGWVDIVCR